MAYTLYFSPFFGIWDATYIYKAVCFHSSELITRLLGAGVAPAPPEPNTASRIRPNSTVTKVTVTLYISPLVPSV
jgi:hypothetical protein